MSPMGGNGVAIRHLRSQLLQLYEVGFSGFDAMSVLPQLGHVRLPARRFSRATRHSIHRSRMPLMIFMRLRIAGKQAASHPFSVRPLLIAANPKPATSKKKPIAIQPLSR